MYMKVAYITLNYDKCLNLLLKKIPDYLTCIFTRFLGKIESWITGLSDVNAGTLI